MKISIESFSRERGATRGRVLHLIDSAGLYGAEQVILSLLDELRDSRFPGVLGCIGEPNVARPAVGVEAEKMGLPVQYLVMRRGLRVEGIRAIARCARNEGVNIVHTHGYKPNILTILIPMRRFASVATVHGWAKQAGNAKTKLYEFLDVLALRRMDRVVAVSHAVVDDLKSRRLVGDRVRLIYNGIQLARNGQTRDVRVLRERYGLAPRDYVIGAVGRLAPVKGHEYLIRAMALIAERIGPSRLLIAGDGPLRDQLQRLAESLGLANRVRLIGYVKEMGEFLSLIDAYVLPSLSEGLPISLLEAMAAAKPVIATDVGGSGEVIGDPAHGVLVSPCDAQALADAVIALHRDGERATAIGAAGRESVIGRFSSKAMAAQYVTLYEELVESSR